MPMEAEAAEPVQRSLLAWMLGALGLPLLAILLLAGVLCFVLALFVVIRGRGPMAAAALVLIVPIPLLIGIFAAVQGAIASYSVIATSASTPKPSELAAGISAALFAPLVGMLVMVPAYVTAVLGALVRSLRAPAESGKPVH